MRVQEWSERLRAPWGGEGIRVNGANRVNGDVERAVQASEMAEISN